MSSNNNNNNVSSFATVQQGQRSPIGASSATQKSGEDSTQNNVLLDSELIFWWETQGQREVGPRTMKKSTYMNTLNNSGKINNTKGILAFAQDLVTSNGKVMLFKDGIQPVWEDRANFNGGRFHLSCVDREQAITAFFDLLTSVLCEKSVPFAEVCGFVINLKPGSISVELWNKSAKKKELVKNTRKNLKKLFKRNILYFVHRTSVNIAKFGPDQVKQQGAADQGKLKETLTAKHSPVEEEEVADSAPANTIMLKKQPLTDVQIIPTPSIPTSCANDSNIMDALNTAMLTASLTNAWNTRTVQV